MPIGAFVFVLAIAPTLATPAVPATNPATWVTTADYPPDALRTEAEGKVAFELRVGPNGRPTGCTIKASSGNSALDETTCSMVLRRARFTPALDKRGQPTEGTYSNQVRWTIPPGGVSNSAAFERARFKLFKGERVVTYTIKTDGTVANCSVAGDFGAGPKVAEIDGHPAPEQSGGQFCPPPQLRFVPPTDDQGQPGERKIRETHRYELLTP